MRPVTPFMMMPILRMFIGWMREELPRLFAPANPFFPIIAVGKSDGDAVLQCAVPLRATRNRQAM
jgi:hypothetical protein